MAVVVSLTGCLAAPAPPARDRHLLDFFVAELETGAPKTVTAEIDGAARKLKTGVPHQVRLAASERRALLTHGGAQWAWTVDDDLGAGDALAFSLALLGPGGAEAIVERVAGDQREELYRAALSGSGWSRRRVPLVTRGPAAARQGDRLILRSEGPAPVAWAEIHSLNGTSTVDGPPDLVLISIDTVRADHLSVYGYPRPTTPGLERLASESIMFDRALSPSSWTLPSTATLLTGLLPAQHGLRATRHRLEASVDTLAEKLRRQGYRTAAITDGGFVGFGWGLSQGFERYDATAGEAWAGKDVAQIVDAASRWLEDNRFHPYFLFVHTYEAHKPYRNPEGFADPFLDASYDGPFKQTARFDPLEVDDLTEVDQQRIVDFYDGEIRRADHYLGQFLDRLRARERWRDTAVLVTSDHGEELLDHGDFDHGFAKVFDANVRVPMILKPVAGDTGHAGLVVETPVTGLDVAPTLLALAGVVDAESLPGKSLLALAGEAIEQKTPPERMAFVHATNSFPDMHEERYRLDLGSVSVVFDQVRDTAEWYDLEQDPERRSPRGDVFSGPAAEAARSLQAILAWSVDAELIAGLPEGTRRLRVPSTSKLEPLGAWSGLSWREASPVQDLDAGWHVELDPRVPGVLVFSPRRGESGWSLEIETGSAARREIRLRAARPEVAWNPLIHPMAEPELILPGAALFQPGTLELSEDDVAELKALGYL